MKPLRMCVGGATMYSSNQRSPCSSEKHNTAILHREQQALKGALRRIPVGRITGRIMRAQQQRDSLPLGEAGIPGRFQRIPILPVKVMVPDPDSMRVLLEIATSQSLAARNFFCALLTLVSRKQIVVPQSPLRDRDGVVLQADLAVIVEHGNTVRIVASCVVAFSENAM